jgi:ribosomal-protein-alanine N-acetyltransferase
MSAVEIRAASLRDWWEVRELERVCFGPDAWTWVELLFALVGPHVRLKAVVGGQLAGLVIGEAVPFANYAWIVTLGVLPDYQRRGLGARLLAEAEARLRSPVLKLTVRQSNRTAMALYEKFGYAPAGRHEHYYSGGETGIVMEKRRG